MFKRDEKPKAPEKPCARCGGEGQWTIWGFRTCIPCRNHWDEHAPTGERVVELASEQKKTTLQVWTEWTSAWVRAGARAKAS